MTYSFGATSIPDEAMETQPTAAKSAKSATALIPTIRAAATIGFAVAPCSLGFVVIAVSEHRVRSILVGDDPEMLLSDLQNQVPSDALSVDENHDPGLVAKVVDMLARADEASELPLDMRGTDFPMQVWDALRKIPAGTTANFTFLAEQIPTCGAVDSPRH